MTAPTSDADCQRPVRKKRPWRVVVTVETFGKKRGKLTSTPLTYSDARALVEENRRMGRAAEMIECP